MAIDYAMQVEEGESFRTGKAQGQRERVQIVQKVYQEMQRIDRKIMRRTTVNREEIMNDNFLVLAGQEEFVNPYTGKVETDMDAYRYRWSTVPVFTPTLRRTIPTILFRRGDFKRTPVRPRRCE